MICMVCHTQYHLQNNSWKLESSPNKAEGNYMIQSNVFTPEILEQILEHALQNEFNEISVDSYLAEYVLCEGCQLLNLRLRKERDKLFDLPKYQNLIYYDSF